jgi:cyclohexadienyl dehydratase
VTRGLFHAAEIEALGDNGAVRDAFADGRADAAMTNTFEAPRWAEGVPDAVAIGPLTHDVTALWLRAEDESLAADLDAFLLDEEASGRLDALRQKTLGPGGGGPTALPVPALVAATAERLALMPLVAAAKRRAGKAIFDPAQEERVLAAAADAVARASAAPPPRAAVERFFRAQMEAAKAIQEQERASDEPPPSLEALRAAIGRITARMARLAGRIPRGTTLAEARAAVTAGLGDTALDEARTTEIAAALARLAP